MMVPEVRRQKGEEGDGEEDSDERNHPEKRE
jgi:hypothetical protein